MILNKKIFFIPDFDNKSGYGHYYRCLNFLEFFKNKYKTFILIKKNKNNKIFFSKKKNTKIIFFFDLKSVIKKYSNKKNFFFIDSYNKKKIDIINNLTKNTISTADNLTKINTKYLIDHTFLRKKKDHQYKNPKSTIYVSHFFFPFIKKNKNKKRKYKYIMVNFGTHNSKRDILSVLTFIKRLKLDLNYKILIIDKSFRLNFIENRDLKNIFLIRYTNNLNDFYSKTVFCFGACGISLYERSFYKIPSICKPIARNQTHNYQNFLRKNCILDFNSTVLNKKFTIVEFNEMIKVSRKNLNIYFSSKKQISQINKLVKRIK